MSAVPTTLNSAASRRSLQADTLGASVIILLVATVVQRTIGFGRGVLFCRWLTPDTLGQWELTYSFLMLAAPLSVLGVPGSFGRYAAHYRQRGHLRTFVHRAAAWTAVCTVAAVAIVEIFAEQLSQVMFGEANFAPLVRGIGLCLGTVILQHTLTSLLAALRLYRIVSALNFVQSIMFAGISLALLWRHPAMGSIVIGYSVASLTASVGALVWAWPALHGLEPPTDYLKQSEFWFKLMHFAFAVWVTNLLTNLFAVIDRYMLVHCAGLTPEAALVQVGHYHTSRVVPLLLVSVTELLSSMLMPHLSHDWELGRRDHASARLNLAVKLVAAGMLAAGTCILAGAPFLFHVVFQGRFNEGLAIMPWTMAGFVWYGIYLIAQNYLWCAEKTRLAMVPLAIGLAVNVLLNFALLPSYGLHGAVLSIAISTAVCLATTLVLNSRYGMRLDRGTWLVALCPLAIGFGLWPAAVACVLLAVAMLAGELVLTADERRELAEWSAEALRNVLGPLGQRGDVGVG